MATYTVTRVMTRPNTLTAWPAEALGGDGYSNLSEKVTTSYSYDSDNLVQTTVFVWSSKEDFLENLRTSGTRDNTLNTISNQYNDYKAANNITSRVTREDGSVVVFNSSSKTYEAE